MLAALRSADLSPSDWLTPGDLALILRSAYDPAVAGALERHGDLGRDLATAGPVAVTESWGSLRSDSAHHCVLWISEWPRSLVFPGFLAPLLLSSGIRRTFSLLYTPMRTDRAARDIRKKKTEYISDAAQRQKIGQIEDAQQTAEYQDVLQQEADLTAGHGVLRHRLRRGQRERSRRARARRRGDRAGGDPGVVRDAATVGPAGTGSRSSGAAPVSSRLTLDPLAATDCVRRSSGLRPAATAMSAPPLTLGSTDPKEHRSMSSHYTTSEAEAVYDACASIPAGTVITYADLAQLVGRPTTHARTVSTILGHRPNEGASLDPLPWWRVVQIGRLTARRGPGHRPPRAVGRLGA